MREAPEHEEYLEASDGTQVFMRSWLPQRGVEHGLFAVHGMGSHSESYRRMALELGERKIATFGIDMRGFGHTGTRGDAENFHLAPEDINMAFGVVRERYPGLPASLLALSLGVPVTLRAFGRFPELVPSTVILLAGRIKGMEPRSQMWRFPAFRIKNIFVRDARFDTRPSMSNGFRETELAQVMVEDELSTWRFSKRMMMGMAPFMDVEDSTRGAAKMAAPTLIVHGESDTVNHPDGSRQLHENVTSRRRNW
jgi:alpha-beta hydrolase superfamily lysophospholipase